ncbi:MAG: phosphoglycerate dehydrogenase [Terriglobia bacterium]
MTKVVVSDPIAPRGLALLRAEGWQVVECKASPAEKFAAELAEATAWILRSGTRVTAEVLARAPQLKVIGRAGIGTDNIDLDAATRRGVLVMNTPGGNAVSVAEHTCALLLALARHVPAANQSVHSGAWEKPRFTGIELKGKTLGIIGLGRIGTEVARRALAFEMEVLAHDPFVAAPLARELGVRLVGLDELLAQAHFITLHAGLSPATKRLLRRETLAKTKPGVRIVNTARGELIDQTALAEALQSGQVAAAALDVFPQEPPRTSPLLRFPQLIATPHIAGSTEEAQEEVGWRIAQQVRDFLQEGIIRNAVNLPTLSAEEYRRTRPYLELGERLGSFLAQIAPGHISRVSLRYAGEVGELNTNLVRNAVLKGVLSRLVSEPANLVNAGTLASERGISLEEATVRRTQGFPNTLGVTLHEDPSTPPFDSAQGKLGTGAEATGRRQAPPAPPLAGPTAGQVSIEGTLLHGAEARILAVDEIEIEAPLAGRLIFLRNRDIPGVIGQVGTLLGNRNINIASFALGRQEDAVVGGPEISGGSPGPGGGGEALAVIRVDTPVPEAVLDALRRLPAITFAQLVEPLPAKPRIHTDKRG